MNFKEWLLTEEIYFQNNTATVFHRTKEPTSIKGIISSGYRPGKGCFHGCGLYTTYELSAQMRSNMIGYGRYIMKYKVANLNKYLVFELDKAKQIHKQNWTLSSQITRLSPSLAEAIEQSKIKSLEDLNEWQQASKNGSDISQFLHEKFKLDYFASLDKETFKGIIYYGDNDGPCLLKYNPINEGTDIILLAYADAPSGANIESLQWIQSTSLASLRTHSNYLKQMQGKNFTLTKDDPDIVSQLLKSSSDTDLTAKKIIYNRGDSLTDGDIKDLLSYANDKQKIVKLIVKYKTNLIGANVYRLILYAYLILNASDGQEIIDLLGSKNINKLSDQNVENLFSKIPKWREIAKLILQYKTELSDNNVLNLLSHAGYADNRQEIAKLIIQYKNDLNDSNVYLLLYYADDKQEIANLLGSKNINKLSGDSVYRLLHNAKNKQEIANLLGSKNINKLSDENIGNLFYHATNKQDIFAIIGSENISKLSDDNVGTLLNSADDKQEMAKFIIQSKTYLSDNNVVTLLLSADDKQEIAKLIIQKKPELSDKEVLNLLYSADDKQEIADLLGSENISKLSDGSVMKLLNYAKNKQEMAKLIIQYKTDLSDDDVSGLLKHASDKQEIAKLIIQKKPELIDDNVRDLLRYADDKQEIAKLIIQKKPDLNDKEVFALIYYADDKKEIADLLGSENISKISDQNKSEITLTNVIGFIIDEKQKEMAKIFLEYHKNLSDEHKMQLEKMSADG